MKKILMIGEYFPLKEARAALLSMTGAWVKHCSTAEFTTRLANDEFDLVVLCHTVPEDARSWIMTDVRLRWPRARIMQFFTGYGRPSACTGVDAYVPATEPAKLIQWATELLGKPPSIQKCRFVPPAGSLANLCYFYSSVISTRRSLLGGPSHPWVSR